MTQMRPVSRERLVKRRSQLKRRRQVQRGWSLGQFLAAIALLGGTGWLITAPIWVLRSPDQIIVEGTTHFDGTRIRQLLGLTYPQSLWRLDPDGIADSLRARAPLGEVTVTRRLIPPGLTVHVQELQPVAVVKLSPERGLFSVEGAAAKPGSVGLIDRQGKWIEIARYQQAGKGGRSLPPLKLIAPPSRLSQVWTELYSQIKLASVRISTIQWQDADNLILETELGTVHCGPLSPHFGDQLRQLARLRTLPDQMNQGTFDYIDLRNPETPLLQTKKPGTAPSSS